MARFLFFRILYVLRVFFGPPSLIKGSWFCACIFWNKFVWLIKCIVCYFIVWYLPLVSQLVWIIVDYSLFTAVVRYMSSSGGGGSPTYQRLLGTTVTMLQLFYIGFSIETMKVRSNLIFYYWIDTNRCILR